METNSSDGPEQEVKIVDCGQIKPGEDLGICSKDDTLDTYPHHPEDLDLDWDKADNFDAAIEIIRFVNISINFQEC